MLKKIKLKIGVWLIKLTSRKLNIDLLRLGYTENGILKSHSFEASGEIYFINSFLKKKISEEPILFDVGGNKGEYTVLLKKQFPKSRTHTFEPNSNTYKVLEQNCGTL